MSDLDIPLPSHALAHPQASTHEESERRSRGEVLSRQRLRGVVLGRESEVVPPRRSPGKHRRLRRTCQICGPAGGGPPSPRLGIGSGSTYPKVGLIGVL